MKNKYYKFFVIDFALTFLIPILLIILSVTCKNGLNYSSFFNNHYLTIVLMVVAVSLFIVTVRLYNKKYTLDVKNLFVPICHLVFTSLIIIVALVLNYYVIVLNMHFVYYYRFVVISYLFLNTYTLLSLKK